MPRHLDFRVLCRRLQLRLARSDRDALPGAKSLRDAFEAAKKAIAEREHHEHETPSNPQAYFGAELEAKLAAMGG